LNPIHRSLEKSLKALHINRDARLLLGVSGGIDSMVLLHALAFLKYNIIVSHINFKLRGQESDGDAKLVQEWCNSYHIPFLLKEIDTKKFSTEENLNTQLAARKIRYDWWESLHEDEEFDFVATAHTLDDQVESFFINVLRGTGMKGLQGITSRRDFFIRPMLEVNRESIEAYAIEYQVPYRTDQSNLADDYQRNRIRHHLIPLLTELSPGFQSRMKHNLFRLQKEWNSWEQAYQEWIQDSMVQVNDSFAIECNPQQESFLLRWLEEKGIPWNLSSDFISSNEQNTGHMLQWESYRLSRTKRGYNFEKIKSAERLIIPAAGIYKQENLIFSIQPVKKENSKFDNDPGQECISSSVVNFPLQLRPVEPGDAFQPLGMQGRQKKIQDLLVDRKMDMHEKSKVRLLTNDQHILWVTGIQLDERAKVNDKDEWLYIVTVTYR
jgi:tRNA(Ile)-lysidine synthase